MKYKLEKLYPEDGLALAVHELESLKSADIKSRIRWFEQKERGVKGWALYAETIDQE